MLNFLKMQESIKKTILEAAIQIIPFEGWSPDLFERITESLQLQSGAVEIIFPEGLHGLFKYYIQNLDIKMIKKYQTVVHDNLNTHQRIRLCLIVRLKILNQYKTVCQKSLAFLALPTNYVFAAKMLWNTVDLIWHEAGHDQSTDFNYYTKRILLGSVYSSTLLFFSNDASDNFQDIVDFLDRRLADVYKMSQIKSNITSFFNL